MKQTKHFRFKCDCEGRVIDYPKPMYPSFCGKCGGWF